MTPTSTPRPPSKSPGERRFTGLHMLALVVGFFAVVIAANGTMAMFALSTWSGLVAQNGYVASQAYNGVLEAAARQKELGWTSRLDYSGGRLTFVLTDTRENPVTGLIVRAKLGRVVHEKDDRTLDLAASGDGAYGADVGPLGTGIWQVSVIAEDERSGRLYRQIFRIDVAAGG